MGEIMIFKDTIRKSNIHLLRVKNEGKKMAHKQYLKRLRSFRIKKYINAHI